MQYLVEYIDPKLAQDAGFAANGGCYPYCYVEAESESTAIAAANRTCHFGFITVENATATALREERGETFGPEEWARQTQMGWRRC